MKKMVYLLMLLCFITLCQAETGWKGKWISVEQSQSKPNTWLAFRKEVMLAAKPDGLTARIAADSKYWLWINNEPVVFEGGLKRGPARNATYYDEIEIAPYLTQGENTIAVLVWHFGKNGFNHINSGTAALLFEAVNADIEIVSDESWKAMLYGAYQDTEAPFPNYRMPESNIRFDARKEVAGWNRMGFTGRMPDVSYFVHVEDAPQGQLVKRPIPMFKDYGLRDYTDIRKSADGDTLFCKLPYNCQITPYLKVKAKAGAMINMLTDNYMGGGSPNVRAEYIIRDGEQAYESFGWMNGHEVWYVIPDGVEVMEVKYRETGYNTEFVEPFQCNDPFLNELWKRSARTLYITMRDNYMDCPDRERSQWWGDEVNELGEAFYALTPSSHQLALKGIYELMNWQRADGVIFSPVPAGNWNRELPLQMLASVGWYGFYTQYFYSADSSFVPVIYDRLHRYLHDVWKVDFNGLAIERTGEWNWGDWGNNIDLGVLTNCWYYLALKAEREFALQLNKTSDASEIRNMMSRIEAAFDRQFWTGTAYRSPGYEGETDDRAQAMAVVSGLAGKDKYPALTKVFKTAYHASPYMEKYVLEALCMMGEATFAMERMKSRYANMMNFDYTTLFEGWGIGDEGFGGGTINHAWSGGPLTVLSQKICGIEPLSPGFLSFRVAPQMGSLTEASASVASVNGEIKVNVKKNRKMLSVSVTVPIGTSCEVSFPSGKKVSLSSGEHTVQGN
ncbi:MAG: glycoside hydrolase [Tannerella sp.]|nr:glycoside hydrolase [Tannerella sp.]